MSKKYFQTYDVVNNKGVVFNARLYGNSPMSIKADLFDKDGKYVKTIKLGTLMNSSSYNRVKEAN